METTKIALFKGKQIRRTLHKNEWWFVIVDVIATLTDSVQPDGYIKGLLPNGLLRRNLKILRQSDKTNFDVYRKDKRKNFFD